MPGKTHCPMLLTYRTQVRVVGRNFLAAEDEHGRVVDFHALRTTFITNLSRSGVAPKTAQLLARHCDINLTMNTYTMLGVMDTAAAVETLPAIPNVSMARRVAAS